MSMILMWQIIVYQNFELDKYCDLFQSISWILSFVCEIKARSFKSSHVCFSVFLFITYCIINKWSSRNLFKLQIAVHAHAILLLWKINSFSSTLNAKSRWEGTSRNVKAETQRKTLSLTHIFTSNQLISQKIYSCFVYS